MRQIITFAAVLLIASQAWAVYTPKRSWVQLAGITYQNTITGTDAQRMYDKLGYYDMLINPGGTVKSTFRQLNPNGAVINYLKASSMFSPNSIFNELPTVTAWATSKGISAPYGFIYRPTANVTLRTIGADNLPHIVNTLAGNYLEFFFWADFRYAFDLRDTNLLGFYVHRARQTIGADDGVMEDEALGSTGGQGRVALPGCEPPPLSNFTAGTYADLGWGSLTETQVADSLSRFLTNWWYPRFSDSIYNMGDKFYFKNYAAYFYMTDSASLFEPSDAPNDWNARYVPNDQERQNYVGHKNINLLLGEYCGLTCAGFSRQWQYLGYMNQLVDSGCRAILWCGPQYSIGAQFPGPYNLDIANYGKERAFRNQYCYYLMAAHPTKTWWLCVSNQAQTTMWPGDTIIQRGIVEYNIGTPLAKFTEPAPVNSFHHYLRLKRRYSNAVVLFTNNGPTGFTYDLTADTSTYHCTGFYEVQDNGSLSATSVTSIALSSVDGRIMVPNTGQPVKTISIGNASGVTEGGQLAFPVTRNWSDAAVTIFYNTVDGTAVAPGDYVAELNGQLTIPAGFSSGTIFVLTNADALLEPTQTMSVHLSSSSDGSIITADANGSIIDGTTPPSTTDEKKLKLKKE